MSDRIMRLPCTSIVIGDRHRKDMGDLKRLADSMHARGLLQPVGIDHEMNLLFGERRLRAALLLGWETISARILDVDALLAEHDENEVRKDFTVSERVAIGQAIEERIGNRRGQRTDLKAEEEDDEELRQNFAEVVDTPAAGQRTDTTAAEAAGFGNRETYRQAKAVVVNGTPELIEAMDMGKVSISAAAQVAKLPKPEQEEAVKDIEKGKKPAPAAASAGDLDGWGIPVQPHAKKAFEAVPEFEELLRTLKRARQLFNKVANLPGGKFLTLPGVASYLRGKKDDQGNHADRFIHEGIEKAIAQVRDAVPTHTVCPWRFTDGEHPVECGACKGLDWTPPLSKTAVPSTVIERIKQELGQG